VFQIRETEFFAKLCGGDKSTQTKDIASAKQMAQQIE
jgi:putative component of toxin-antitoxin plasmid stabilization module